MLTWLTITVSLRYCNQTRCDAVSNVNWWIASGGDNLPIHATILTDSVCYKWKMDWEAQTCMCQWMTSTLSKTPMDVLPCICWDEGKWLRLVSQKIWSVEQLEILPVGTKPRTSHHQSPGGERCGQRKHLMIFLERMREDHCQPDKHWHCFKGNIQETYERWGGVHMGFSKYI